MKKYSLQIVDQGKSPRFIVESEESLQRVRSIASSIKKKFGRKFIISCDGKEMRNADDVAYKDWLEKNESI